MPLLLLAVGCLPPGHGKDLTGEDTPTDATTSTTGTIPHPDHHRDHPHHADDAADRVRGGPDARGALGRREPALARERAPGRASSLSAKASVAVACTLRSEPTEVHLMEDVAVGKNHTLRIGGLLADSDYDCVAAATCPETPAPAAFSVHTGPPSRTSSRSRPPTTAARAPSTSCSTTRRLRLHPPAAERGRPGGSVPLVVRDPGQRSGRRWSSGTTGTTSSSGAAAGTRTRSDGRARWTCSTARFYDSVRRAPGRGDSDFHHDGKQLPDGSC